MAANLAQVRQKAATALSPALTRLVAAVLSAALLAWTGLRVSRTDAARRRELREAEATLATFAGWRRRFEPAVAAESIAWRRTLMELQALGVIGDERLRLTQMVSRAAERAGLRDVRVSVTTADTTGSDARLSTEGVHRQTASFGLSVECRGNLQAVVSFLGDLPASVAPTQLSLVRQDGRARHRVALAVYELQFPNGFPVAPSAPVSSSLERSDSDRLSVSRSGG
jgi:hypothetical protein